MVDLDEATVLLLGVVAAGAGVGRPSALAIARIVVGAASLGAVSDAMLRRATTPRQAAEGSLVVCRPG